MANARIVFNSDGFKQLLNSPEVEVLVLNEAQKIADAASEGLEGEGFRAHSTKAGTRYIAFAGTTDEESILAESENKVLSRAVMSNG